MSIMTTHAIGTFCFPGLCSGDAAKSKKFYSSLFGWEAQDISMSGGGYTVFKMKGQNATSMYEMKPERLNAGVVPHWNAYVAVEDAAQTAQKAASLGAKVLNDPFDAGGDRMANLQDPTGAKFSLWQFNKAPEPTLINEVGALCWTELYTNDTRTAQHFYSDLFGWHAQPFGDGPMPYTIFSLPSEPRGFAGMLPITEEMHGRTPQWVPYFMVEDADKTAGLARKLGAQIHGPEDIPTVGRIAVMVDPEGATFAIIKPSMG